MVCGRVHLAFDALADGRVLESLSPRLVSAFLHPRRHGGVEAGLAGGVSVHVRGDAQTRGARGFDLLDERVQFVPVRLTGGLQVVKLGRNFCFARNSDQLVGGLQQTRSFAANVRDVHAAVFGSDFGQRNQFVRLRVEGRRVNQRRPDAKRAFFHRLANELLHSCQLCGCGGSVGVTDFVDAHGRRADERSDVAGNAALNEVIEIVAERRPFDIEFDVALTFVHLLFHRVVERTHRFALAHNLKRDALANAALRTAVLDERFVGLTEHVDEAGRDGEPAGVNFSFAARVGRFADRHDAVAVDGHITDNWRPAAAVVNRPVADKQVVVRRHYVLCEKERRRERARQSEDRRSFGHGFISSN